MHGRVRQPDDYAYSNDDSQSSEKNINNLVWSEWFPIIKRNPLKENAASVSWYSWHKRGAYICDKAAKDLCYAILRTYD